MYKTYLINDNNITFNMAFLDLILSTESLSYIAYMTILFIIFILVRFLTLFMDNQSVFSSDLTYDQGNSNSSKRRGLLDLVFSKQIVTTDEGKSSIKSVVVNQVNPGCNWVGILFKSGTPSEINIDGVTYRCAVFHRIRVEPTSGMAPVVVNRDQWNITVQHSDINSNGRPLQLFDTNFKVFLSQL